MIPLGYLAKKVSPKPDRLKNDRVADIYSVSACISTAFADYIRYWQHNGYWLFDSPQIIINLAAEHRIDLDTTLIFYYEAYELEHNADQGIWQAFAPEKSLTTQIVVPAEKTLHGYDIVSFSNGTAPECSPLSCNYLAEQVTVNNHCLLGTLDEAKQLLEQGKLNHCEPGPYRIVAVYTVSRQDDFHPIRMSCRSD